MYAGREHKEAVRRVIEQPKRNEMQQFKREYNQRNISTQTVFQMYSKDENGFKVSDNNKYGTDGSSNRLFYSSDASFPQPKNLFEKLSDKDGWQICRYKAEIFKNDCGDFASALMTDNTDYMDDSKSGDLPDFNPITTKKKLTNIEARDDKQFLNRLPDSNFNPNFAWNDHASPKISEAYFAARTTLKYEGCPYHVATVVAKDGDDKVTCEADASSDAIEPVFDMYSTRNIEQTFHKEQTSGYGNQEQPGITAVVNTPPILNLTKLSQSTTFKNKISLIVKALKTDIITLETDSIYYHVIKTPISFDLITQKTSNNQYTNFDNFHTDINLLIENCKLIYSSIPSKMQMAIDRINKTINYLPLEFKYPVSVDLQSEKK